MLARPKGDATEDCKQQKTFGNLAGLVELLPQVKVPTLVMHARGDGQVPFEVGRQLAAEIPGAKFVALQSSNHVPLEHDPATQRFFEEVNLFLGS